MARSKKTETAAAAAAAAAAAPSLETLRAECVQAVRSLATAGVRTWARLYAAAHAGLEPSAALLIAIWKDAGETLKDSSAGAYSSELARAYKMGKAGKPLPALQSRASMRDVTKAVRDAYVAAGLKDPRGGTADPVTAAKAEATAAAKKTKAAMKAAKAVIACDLIAKTAYDRAKADGKDEVLALDAAAAATESPLVGAAMGVAADAVAALIAANTALQAAQAAKGPQPVTLKTASVKDRGAYRAVLSEAVPSVAALARQLGGSDLGAQFAAKLADLERDMRTAIGAIDELAAKDSAGK